MNFDLWLERLKNEPEWVVLIALVVLLAVGGSLFYYYQVRQDTRAAQRQFRRASTLFNRADRTGNYEQALTVLRRFLNNHGESRYADKAHFFLGKSYYRTGQYISAIKQFRRLRQNYPGSFFAESAKLYIGYANLERKKYSQAKRAFRELADNAGDHPIWAEAQWQLSLLEYRQGNTDRARNEFETLLQSDRELEDFWRNWGRRLKNRLSAES